MVVVISGLGLLLFDAIKKSTGWARFIYAALAIIAITGFVAHILVFIDWSIFDYALLEILKIADPVLLIVAVLIGILWLFVSIRETKRITLPQMYVITTLLVFVIFLFYVLDQNTSAITVITP